MSQRRRVGWATTAVVMASAGVVARTGRCFPSAIGIRARQTSRIRTVVAAASSTRCGLVSRQGKPQPFSGARSLGLRHVSGFFCRQSRSRRSPNSNWSAQSVHGGCCGIRMSSGSSSRGGNGSNSAKPVVGRPAQTAEAGVVYFVSTPIGNLEDITLRAMNVLRTADVIAAEDTRTTGSLLKLLGVERTGRLVSHHDHNTRRRVPEIVEAAREGKSVAVVSDAGTPGISDPGMELVAACVAEGVRVVPVPGACAAVAAVSVSGFPSHEFVFFGFVGGKRGSAVRRRKLEEIAQEPRTCIMYEAPHRIADTLRGLLTASCPSSASSPPRAPGGRVGFGEAREDDKEEGEENEEGVAGGAGEETGSAAEVEAELAAGRRPVVLARELTKLHEEIFRGTLADAVARYGGGGSGGKADSGGGSGSSAASIGGGVVKDPRGEFTVILGPRAAASAEEGGVEGAARAMAALEARLVELTAGGMSTSSAVKMASKDLNLKKSDVYRVALRLQPSGVDSDG